LTKEYENDTITNYNQLKMNNRHSLSHDGSTDMPEIQDDPNKRLQIVEIGDADTDAPDITPPFMPEINEQGKPEIAYERGKTEKERHRKKVEEAVKEEIRKEIERRGGLM